MFILLMFLVSVLALLIYMLLAHPSNDGPRHDWHHVTQSRGDRAMTPTVVETDREQVTRWVEERGSVLEGIHRILVESTQFKAAAEAAHQECDRLRHESELLRAEVSRLTAETERVQRERAETAQWLTAMLNELASRLRIERPPT
jgi:hypothetical protein